MIVHAVEGEDFGPGTGLSAAVAAVVPRLVAAVAAEARGLRSNNGWPTAGRADAGSGRRA